MLTDPRQRLIIILGPGGISKTRLAMEVATTQLPTFDERVYFIQLAAFNASDSILPAIASVLNILSSTIEELKNRLSDYFREKKALIVLDNFEHLMGGAPQISELLQRTPSLKILVTSRERLNLQGEWTFELSGLSVLPKADEGKAVYSALQLFELHIQRMRPEIEMAGRDREAAESVVGVDRTVLLSLVSKSLVQRYPNGRFDLHEIIRQYSFSHLGNETGLRKKHSRYYLGLLHQPKHVPFGSESDLERIHNLRVEYGNLQLAWGYVIEQKMYEELGEVLDNFWLICAINGWFQEGLDLSLVLIDPLRGRAKTPSEKIFLSQAMMSALGHLARMGEFESADRLSVEASELLRDAGEIEYLSNTLISHARIASVMGRHSYAHTLANEGRELASRHENRWLLGLAYVTHRDIYSLEGNHERAYELIRKGLSIYEELWKQSFHGLICPQQCTSSKLSDTI